MCVLEWKVECKSHDDEGGDKEDEGACEYGSEKLLLKLAGIIVGSGGKCAYKTDKQQDKMIGIEDIVLHASELILAEEVE
jgi:hypothetical protein